MRRRTDTAVAGFVLACLCGCGGPHAQDEAEGTREPPRKTETVFDDTIRTQDRARAVEDVTMASKAATDAAIDEADGGGSREPQD